MYISKGQQEYLLRLYGSYRMDWAHKDKELLLANSAANIHEIVGYHAGSGLVAADSRKHEIWVNSTV